MKITDIRKKTAAELEKELAAKAEALKEFAFGVSGAKAKNTKAGRNTRKDIARIRTVMAEMRRAEK